jgi:hypothetical protein
MKVEGLIFAICFAFFALAAPVYAVLSREWAGSSVLALSAGLSFLIAFYLWFTGRRIDARPEENPEAEVSDGAGELGFFSPHSWWPLGLAAGAAVIFVGVIYGWWLVSLGAVVLLIALYGMLFEYYRGQHD